MGCGWSGEWGLYLESRVNEPLLLPGTPPQSTCQPVNLSTCQPSRPPPLPIPAPLQGPNQMMWVLPTGGYDPRKHSSYEACARAELSEEAHLTGGDWWSLLPEGHPGIAEVKWCM